MRTEVDAENDLVMLVVPPVDWKMALCSQIKVLSLIA